MPAYSQDSVTETVYVTGSRIARPSDFESPSPVDTVSRVDIQRSGYTNLQQLLEKVPSNGNGALSTRGNNQDSTANGAASVSLRGLGADATLVLVNGRRVSISPFADNITTNFVDINSIPVAAIERVEVLKDGASAVYGSDAVAGVVNIILRKNYQGLELSGSYGAVTDGNYGETNLSALWGIGNEDSNVTMIFDYFKNDTLMNTDRGHLGSANQEALGGFDLRSSRGYPGSFIVNGVNTRDPNCPPASQGGANCFYDYGPWNLLIPEAERTGFMLMAHQALGGGVELFGEATVQHNNSIAQGAPTPIDDSAGLTVPVTHPNNPFVGATSIAIRRYRTVDAGPRQWDITSDTLRGLLGLRGAIGDWDWEVAGTRARGKSEQSGDRSMGWVRIDFLQQQINQGLYNPFGGVQNPQSVIDAITTSLVRRGEADLTNYDAQISGPLFDIAGRSVRMAAGAEYREESVSDIPDDQFQRGLIFGTEAVSAAASRDIKSAFVEFDVPLLDSLDLNIAGRYDDYSDFGDTTNPKVAVRWAPIEQIALRASWGTGFRAPSLAQTGLGPSQESQFFVDTFGCADNPTYCGALDYLINFTGNPNLQAEESENYNLGVSWKPTGGLEFSVDYWNIDQKKKIDEVPFGAVYQAECNNQASTICLRGTPLAGDTLGPLLSIANTFDNIAKQTAEGVDFEGNYSHQIGPGRLTLGLTWSHLLSYDRVELTADGSALITRPVAGEYEYPEDRGQLTADWDGGQWGVYAAITYVGSFQDEPDALPPPPDGPLDGILDYDQIDTRLVDAWTTLNLQFRYTGIEHLQLMLSIDNALDEDVPFAMGDGDTDVYGYVQSQHSPRGRFWTAKMIYKF